MNNKKKINLSLVVISTLLVVSIPFIFDMKTTVASVEFRGFPFDWIATYPSNGFSFKGLGFLADIIIWYFVLSLVVNLFKKRSAPS